ncbi:hypothetical protein LTS10_010780 [Elasticomyces elasticus]|nr:hypothetical protein LTS10_010780 [Elasticomyces elasticus]
MSNQELPIESAFDCSVCWSEKDRTTGSFTIDESLICEACVIDMIQPLFEAALEYDEAYPVRWGGIILKPEDFPGVFPLILSLRYESRGFEIYSKANILCKQLVVIGEDESGAMVKLLAIFPHDGEASENGVQAHEDLDKAHWQTGSPCPKYNFPGDENAWQPDSEDDDSDEDDEDDDEYEYDEEIEDLEWMMAGWRFYPEDSVSDEDADDEDSEDEEQDEWDSEDDHSSENALEGSSDNEDDGGVDLGDAQDAVVVQNLPFVEQPMPNNVTEAEWQAALVAQSETFHASQQHLIHRIEDLLQLPEGLAENDPDHYNIRLQETAVLRVFIDMARSFRDFVETQPVLTTENIRILGSNNRTLQKLEPLVSKLSSCLETRFLMEAAETSGEAITRAHIGEHVESLLLLTAEIDDSMWNEFPVVSGVYRRHLEWALGRLRDLV